MDDYIMEECYNRWYITVDKEGRITDAWSDGPHPEKDTKDAICVNEKGDYQFRVGDEENPIMFDDEGHPLFAWHDGEIVRV